MIETTAVLESSALPPPVMEIDRGPLVNLNPEQRQEYRKTGTLPKTEAAASSLASAGDSGTPKPAGQPKNEAKPKQTAEERIAQLEATIERIKAGKGIEAKPKADSTPATPAPVTPSAKPKEEDFATHAEYEEAVIDWKVDQREAKKAADAAEVERLAALDAKVEKTRSRHGDIDKQINDAAGEIAADAAIAPVIKQMIYDSEYTGDLLLVIGKDKAELAKFMKRARENPGKTIREIALTESLIAQELEAETSKADEPEPPAKLKTQAPKPPAEAGGRAATPPDSMQAALEGSGGKLNANLKAEFLRRDLARLKG